MKKLYFGIAVLAALSLASCKKEQNISAPEINLVTVTLVADKAGDETKAAAVEEDSKVSYEWTEADKSNLKLFAVTSSDNKEVLTEVEDPTITVSSDNKILTITATVEENTTLRAVVAGEMTSGNKPKIKVSQSPATDNFDPNSEVLVADDVIVSGENELVLTFRRQAVVAKMTLKNMVAGEKVAKVVISSETNLTGYYDYEKGKMTGQNNEITLKYEDVEVGSSKEFPVYFVTMPNESLTLTVTVKTDQFNYTKTFGNGAINFNLGSFTRFGVNMSGCGEPVVDVNYSGEWVIAGTQEKHDFAATAWSSGNFYPASEVTLDAENKVVTVFDQAAPYKMVISRVESGDYAEMYTIVDANGNYLSATGGTSSNYLKGKTEPDNTSYWTIEKNTDGTYNIIASKVAGSTPHNDMRVNWNNGSPRVTCYTSSSGQPKVVLYPFENVVVGEPPAPSYDFESVAELNELVTSTSKSYSGYLTNAVVSFVPATNTAIIKDATGSVMYYKSSHGLKQGQTYTGKITVTAIKYNDLYSEITAMSGASFSGSQTNVDPESVSLADLIGHYDAYQNAYVSVAGLTVVSIGTNNKDINVTDGSRDYLVYYNLGSPSCAVGDVITAIGTVTKFQTTEEVKVWTADDLIITATPPKAITFTQPDEDGCSIAVSVGGSTISSGATVASGTTVTLTATIGDGYSFGGWNVTGASVEDATESTTTFTMGTSAVEIRASFNNNSDMIVDFESDSETYTDWAFTNMTSKQPNNDNISAHGGTYYGTTGGKATASIATKSPIQSPGTLTVYFSRQTTNNTSSTWYIQVSSDGSTWTDVKTQSATSMSKGQWLEVSQDLSSYSNVYVRVYYSGSTAVRNIDDLSLTCN